MDAMDPPYRLKPRFAACMRWGWWVCLSIFVTVYLFIGGTRLIQGLPMPEHWSARPFEMVTLLLTFSFGMGILVYGMGWILGAELSGKSLRAKTFWGRGIEVPLSSVTEVRSVSIEGLPALLVKSNATKSNLHILTLGLDVPEVYDRLYAAAGPTHPLTMWFAPRDVVT